MVKSYSAIQKIQHYSTISYLGSIKSIVSILVNEHHDYMFIEICNNEKFLSYVGLYFIWNICEINIYYCITGVSQQNYKIQYIIQFRCSILPILSYRDDMKKLWFILITHLLLFSTISAPIHYGNIPLQRMKHIYTHSLVKFVFQISLFKKYKYIY